MEAATTAADPNTTIAPRPTTITGAGIITRRDIAAAFTTAAVRATTIPAVVTTTHAAGAMLRVAG